MTLVSTGLFKILKVLFFCHVFLFRILRMKRLLFIFTAVLALAGHIPFSLAGTVASPQIIYTSDLPSELKKWEAYGFIQVGSDDYTDRSEGISQPAVLKDAKKFEASDVLVQTDYLGTFEETEYEEVVVGYDTIEYTETIKGKTYTRTKTITRTKVVPKTYTYSKYRHIEAYIVHFLELPDSIWGVKVQPLTKDVRKSLKRNTGVVVTKVYFGTPAAKAGLKLNDIVISINNKKVLDLERSNLLVSQLAQKKNFTARIIRNGIETNVTVKP